MAFFDFLIWFTVGSLIGIGVGIPVAKFSIRQLKNKDRNKMIKVINGEIPNNLNFEGEIINVQTFVSKDSEGNINTLVFGKDFKKTPQKALIGQKITVLKRIKGLFNKK